MMLSICTLGQMKKPNVKKMEKSVVVVKVFDNDNKFIGWGSGVFIDVNGTCITNYHVLKYAYYAKVITQDGSEFEMKKIIGESETSDLIKFTIKNYTTKFSPAIISTIQPEKGDDVWAMGTPVSIDNMNQYSPGTISQVWRDLRYNGDFVYQITAPISHGSSGGGLFNSKGELIGITSFGISGADAARATLNYAVSIGEMSKLQSVYKDRLESSAPAITKRTEPEYKPIPELPRYEPPKYEEPKHVELPKYGSVSFYTDWSQPIDISIDWNYGTTHSYFSGKPRCGQDGTVNFSLRPGTYNYTAKGELPRFWGSTEYSWNGTVTVTSDGCELIQLPAPVGAKNKEKTQFRSWMLAYNVPDFSSFYITKYLREGKYSIQGSIYRYDKYDSPKTNSWNKYGVDFKRIFSTQNNVFDVSFGAGPSIRYQSGNYQLKDYTNNSYQSIRINSLFYNIRSGLDIIVANRIVVRGELGVGYATQGWDLNESKNKSIRYSNDILNPRFTFDYDFSIGYKLGRLKKKNGDSKTVGGYLPLLIIPSLTDFALSKKLLLPSAKKSFARKGKYKIAVFLSSASIMLGSSFYSNSQYSKYTDNPSLNISNYNNANFAHKLSLVSGGTLIALYGYDILDFFTKIKTIKHN